MKYHIIVLLLVLIYTAGCTGYATKKANTDPITAFNNTGNITIHAISVSSNALFIDTSGTDVLYDAGDRKDSITVINYISKFEIKNLTLIPSHHHVDHMGGMIDIFDKQPMDAKGVGLDVKNVLDSGSQYSTKAFSDFISRAEKENFIIVTRGDKVSLTNDVEIEILSPPSARNDAESVGSFYFSDENDNSIVMKLTYGEFTMLFTGDCEKACEDDMLKNGTNVDADVLSVGHHGSRMSTSDTFLAAVSPEAATIGVAAGNQYGHPHAETIERLSKNKIAIYRTDLNGNIVISTNGKTYDVVKEK